ncbi:MAG: aminomethyl-transferring glycine dehydrogenase subunit GcvPA [Polyangiales bacterium]
MRYLPHTEAEITAMLTRIGVPSIDALFADVPEALRQRASLDLPPALAEPQLMAHLTELAARSQGVGKTCFLGGGFYDHHIPPAVDQLLLRSEFYTAYTPYQAEVSQGTLQAIFEFQTVVCELLGMDVANASMYDAASATAEAVLMARRLTGRTRVLIGATLHPHYQACIRTYLSGCGGTDDIHWLPSAATGQCDLSALRAALDDSVAAVVVGYPNALGVVEDLRAIHTCTQPHGALLVSTTAEAYALGVLEAPGKLGVDIAVAEGQSLATAPSYGGPGVGLLACRQAHLRQLPGRLVGETVDSAGNRGFVLTLSTREQHIRRERATSNICTNHGLVALALLFRTALLGRTGFAQAAQLCFARSEYLKAGIAALPALSLPYAGPTVNEFVVRTAAGIDAAALLSQLAQSHLLVGPTLTTLGFDAPQDFLVAVTEKHARADLDALLHALSEACARCRPSTAA